MWSLVSYHCHKGTFFFLILLFINHVYATESIMITKIHRKNTRWYFQYFSGLVSRRNQIIFESKWVWKGLTTNNVTFFSDLFSNWLYLSFKFIPNFQYSRKVYKIEKLTNRNNMRWHLSRTSRVYVNSKIMFLQLTIAKIVFEKKAVWR